MKLLFSYILVAIACCIAKTRRESQGVAGSRWESLRVASSGFESIQDSRLGYEFGVYNRAAAIGVLYRVFRVSIIDTCFDLLTRRRSICGPLAIER
jgi:hypothetical protein